MPNRISRFWQELKRRNVLKVLAWYSGVAVVLIGLASDVAGPLNLPEWAQRLILIVLIIGFPLTLIISWIFDITPEGLQKTPPLDHLHAVHDPSYDGSIAVLPFQDMSPDKDQEYFCDGIAEEIINALTRVEKLKVIARTSAFAFKGQQTDIREIGRTLNVASVLEGSVRKDGNKLRVTAQLIRVEDGSHTWSDTYDRELKDIFRIQDEISMAIVEKLKMNLRGSATGGILKRYTENTEAYQYYMKGLYYYSMMTPEGNRKAQENYHKAIETDPEYALAYCVVGSNFLFAGLQAFIPPDVALKHAREYTDKALAIDSTVVAAHATLGAISMMYDWDLKAAEKGFYRSVQLNPNTAWDRFFWSYFLRTVGRFDEAISEAVIAVEKDPFNIYINTEMGRTFLLAGRIEQAIERQQRTIGIYPNGFLAHLNLGEALEVKGSLKDAIESYKKAASLSGGNPLAETKLACALHKAGNKKEAQSKIETAENISKTAYVPASLFVPYYLLKKDPNQAFHWLKKACDERDLNLHNLMSTPVPGHRIPDAPPFKALLKETGLIDFRL